jgi:hypothetical protein
MDHQAFAQLLGNYGEFIGAIAVVLTLGYLAVQVRQSRQATLENTKAVRLATYQSFNDSSFSWADSQMLYAAELAEIYAKQSSNELSPEQANLWIGFQLKLLTVMESNYLQHRAGAMDDDLFEIKMRGSVLALLNPNSNGWWLRTWRANRIVLPEFKAYMNDLIDRELASQA